MSHFFHIFDIEKMVVDIIYYRNRIGIEETSEALKNYLKHRDRQIDRFYDYEKTQMRKNRQDLSGWKRE